MPDPHRTNPFNFDPESPRAQQARRVYVRVNDRVQTLRAQPSWVHKLLGYTVLFALLGLVIVFAILAVVVGSVLAIVVAVALGIRKLIQLVTGQTARPGTNRTHDTGRANVRVVHRR